MKYVRSTRTIDPQTTVVTCQGEMDTLAVEELHQAVDPLLGDSFTHLVFDLAAVEYVSSSVLSFLMAVQGRAQEKGGKVSLVGASDLVRQVFEMASLDSLFDFRAKLEDLGIVQAPPTQAKGKGKTPKKEKVIPLKEAKPVLSGVAGKTTPSQEAQVEERERVAPVGRQQERPVEKIHPLQERRSWKEYGVWIGIAVAAAVSTGVSLYLYLFRL
jgi:anti-anti-sigma factor